MKVLDNVYHSLQDDGVLVLEMMGKEVLARIFRERDWQEIDGVTLLQERRVTNNWSWMENRWIKIDQLGRSEYCVTHWLYSAAELRVMLEQTGFGNVDVYGDLEGNKYDHMAKRLVVITRK